MEASVKDGNTEEDVENCGAEEKVRGCDVKAGQAPACGGEAGKLSGESLVGSIRAVFACKGQDIRTFSPLPLAYVGDGVYDLVIRTLAVERGNQAADRLHHFTVELVKAGTQAKLAEALKPFLTEEESDVYRRGRNAKPHTMAKNAAPADYRRATGFEALLGYLYLSGRMDRVLELIKTGLEQLGMKV